MKLLRFLTLAIALPWSFAAHAAVVFDFEGLTATDDTGAYTSLALTSQGLTATFTRPGSSFDIDYVHSSGAPASFGDNALSPFVAPTDPAPFVINFSQKLQALSFVAGDFVDNSDVISLRIFSGQNGTGDQLGTITVPYGRNTLPEAVASVSLTSPTPFGSAVVIGGSPDYPNSMFYDNFSATLAPVPLPTSLPLFAGAILGLGLCGRGVKRLRSVH